MLMTILTNSAAILVLVSVHKSKEVIIIKCYEINTRKKLHVFSYSLIIDQI